MEKNEMKLESILEPMILEMGYDLVDIECAYEDPNLYVRVFIDNDKGISLEDCVNVSREIDEHVEKVIQSKFFLEVSSPGIERTLKREKDYIKYIGKKVTVKLREKLNNLISFEGIIKNYEDKELGLEVSGEIIKIPIKIIKKAKLIFDFNEV